MLRNRCHVLLRRRGVARAGSRRGQAPHPPGAPVRRRECFRQTRVWYAERTLARRVLHLLGGGLLAHLRRGIPHLRRDIGPHLRWWGGGSLHVRRHWSAAAAGTALPSFSPPILPSRLATVDLQGCQGTQGVLKVKQGVLRGTRLGPAAPARTTVRFTAHSHCRACRALCGPQQCPH